ncbi:MAG TPA: hypothetical protein IAC31_08425 [Candidatus Faecousia intestinigallinarum]|nr:hypothetical protein [Candidatus Faecousia intestinigallinarum]
MVYYHASPTADISVLEPRKPIYFSEKPSAVYLCTLRPMALLYGVQNFEYTYGYTRDGQIYFEEFWPGALKALYQGKSASLYICAPEETETTRIPNEYLSRKPVRILSQERIPDLYQALLEEAEKNTIRIFRHEELSSEVLSRIRKMVAREIREQRLWERPGAMAEYMRLHYPDSWEDAQK